MPEYMHLIGEEGIRRAGNAMQEAAQDMKQAADNFDYTLHQHKIFMDDWLFRFGEIVEKQLAARASEEGVKG